MAVGGGAAGITGEAAKINTVEWIGTDLARVQAGAAQQIHTDAVYTALINAAQTMENRLAESLKTYQEHPDVQANLQQLQYDLQSWNLALTTMTNIQKNMGDALNSIASNFR
jgi:hypothetical protein